MCISAFDAVEANLQWLIANVREVMMFSVNLVTTSMVLY